ncbi:MAG TPA: GNAT family N-acetyltransferase [Thermoleophilaceae bacterium]|nr:GNAT family N-acetyltransferase [Thermoleophilaceae bacterium]
MGRNGISPLIRPARPDDEQDAVALLLASGGEVYPRFAGSSEAARSILTAAYRRPGNTASAEVVTVAELEGRVAGALAAFPVAEGARRARRYLLLSLSRLPPWRWPRALRLFDSRRPAPPPRALYVDSLATAPDFRRRGVARALLERITDEARERGCTHVALETELENSTARALYRSAGFRETHTFPPLEPGLGQGYVCLVSDLSGASG